MTDWSVYVVTDPDLNPSFSHYETALAAFEAGVDVVQLRHKGAGGRYLLEQALAIADEADKRGRTFFVNDRVDVAAAARCHAHVGQGDLPLEHARSILPSSLMIGVSAGTLEQAVAAAQGGADYVGVGPVFDATATKPDARDPVGLELVRSVSQAVRVPVIAIGGIDHSNAADVIRAGADGVAVVSGVVCAADPRAAAAELLAIVKAAKEERRCCREC